MSWLLIAFVLGLVAGGLASAWVLSLAVVLRASAKAAKS